MSEDTPCDPDFETLVCFCHHVSRGRLRRVIQDGAKTLKEIQAKTCASTGCGGCETEVLEILAEELAKKP